ncbi:MAG: hypothetical protein FWF79_06570 [Defluviitaleaceae bacterium]|nr:hypothetical protein [Defluviitaleaceae bacterium]
MNLDKYFAYLNGIFVFLCLAVLLIGNSEVFLMAYIAVFIIVVARTVVTPSKGEFRKRLIITYAAILILQIVILRRLFYIETDIDVPGFILRRFIGATALMLPMMVSRYVVTGKYAQFYLPSIGETAAIGFSEVMETAAIIKRTAGILGETKRKLCRKNLKEAVNEVARHDSFNYVNNGSLTPDYFEKASQSLSDPNIYIIISKTGSPVSEIISIFTQKQYNHASISFDKELQTTISYNGGEKVYPPGLNMEMIEFFLKSPDSKILVYSLPCPPEKKQLMLDKISEINKEGSAYNMLGLVLKRSYKPNIMFCSQFVYKMLAYAQISYFNKIDGKVSPTDLIELDYYRKLKFEQEIKLG